MIKYIIVWNIIVFLIYGMDKRRAIKNQWRIREGTLILMSFLMGSVGGIMGMVVFRHKTKHVKFKVLIPVSFVMNMVIFYLMRVYLNLPYV